LIDITGIAAKMKVTRQRVAQIVDSKRAGFPEPREVIRQRRLWDEDEVDQWLDHHRPGWHDEGHCDG
jgi:hypothetical protein